MVYAQLVCDRCHFFGQPSEYHALSPDLTFSELRPSQYRHSVLGDLNLLKLRKSEASYG
jgi:hypothetical protein